MTLLSEKLCRIYISLSSLAVTQRNIKNEKYAVFKRRDL